MFKLFCKLTPTHLVMTAGLMALISLAIIAVKAKLMQDYTPPTTFDAVGSSYVSGPYNYGNRTLDVSAMITGYIAGILALTSFVWSRFRPTA